MPADTQEWAGLCATVNSLQQGKTLPWVLEPSIGWWWARASDHFGDALPITEDTSTALESLLPLALKSFLVLCP